VVTKKDIEDAVAHELATSAADSLKSVKKDPWYGAPWPKAFEPDVASAARRALEVGAQPPLEYKGTGMTGVVLCDQRGVAYKAARQPGEAINRKYLEDEAAWLSVASTVPSIKDHVAKFYRYHPDQVVIERECVDERERNRPGDDQRKLDLHREIRIAMEPYGYRGVEFKPDSYRWHPGRGWVLVDASSSVRTGARLVAQAVEILNGRRFYNERPRDVAWALRMEAGRTVDVDRAQRLSDRLEALPDVTEHPSSNRGPRG
jgi:hypothetical protein